MTTSPAARGFEHTAVCHRSSAELVDALVPFVAAGLGDGDRVFVNLVPAGSAPLRAALGSDAARVRWTDSSTWQAHPARRLRAIHELVEVEAGAGRMRFVGQCPFDAGDPELVTEWERFDAVLNRALAGVPVDMVCAYDAAALAPDVVGRAPLTHPRLGPLGGGGGEGANTAYLEPEEYLAQHRVALPPVPPGAARVRGRVKPAEARALVRAFIRPDAALPRARVEDLVVAASEIVTNAWNVGASAIDVACWHAAGEIGLQVDDDGPGVDDPLLGYRRPDEGAPGGRGLWIVRQLADLVQIERTGHRTSVRVRIRDGSRPASS